MSHATTFERGPAKTNGGFRVTILTTTARGPYSLVGLIHSKNELVDDAETWTANGKYHTAKESPLMDLVPQVGTCSE